MDVASHYSEYLSLFIALIVAGMGLKLAFKQSNIQTYRIGDKDYSKQKVHTTATLLLLGLVIQLVSNSMEYLDGRTLLLDQKILAAYAFCFFVLVMRKS